jgi:hypothetical protein
MIRFNLRYSSQDSMLRQLERFAQQALGHNSKAVHRAYAKHAEVTVLSSLDDWEKDWREKPQRGAQTKLVSLMKAISASWQIGPDRRLKSP